MQDLLWHLTSTYMKCVYGPAYATSWPNFLGWLVYQIFLPMGAPLLRCRTITLGGRYTTNHETIPLKYPDSWLDIYLCAMFGYTSHFSFPLCYSIGLQFWKQKTSRKQNWLAKTKPFFIRTEVFYLILKIDCAFYWYFRLLKRAKVAKQLGRLRNDDGDGYENIT